MALMYLSATGGAPGRSWPGECCRQGHGVGLKAGDQLWEKRGAGKAAGCRGGRGCQKLQCEQGLSPQGTARAIRCMVDRLIPSPVTATLSFFDTDLPCSHTVLIGL